MLTPFEKCNFAFIWRSKNDLFRSTCIVVCNWKEIEENLTMCTGGAVPASLATYIQSGIALHPNDYSEIEVKAQRSGFYVLQLRSTRYVSTVFLSEYCRCKST